MCGTQTSAGSIELTDLNHDCSCGTPSSSASSAVAAGRQEFVVNGMTCSHCVMSVTEEIKAIEGVESVEVELVPHGASRVLVSGSRTLSSDEVGSAVNSAGYSLADN
jgi:copper chaperone